MTPSTNRVSHSGSLLKGVAVYRVLYQSILNAKLTGRKNLGRKRCTSNRDDCKLENTVKQSWFNHLWELHKEWTEAGVSASRVPCSDVFRKRATKPLLTRDNVRSILPGLWRKITQWSKVFFQMRVNFAFHLGNKVPESGGRVERHRIHVAWSPVWSFHSQWWFGLPCHLLMLIHCVFWSPQSTQPSTRKFLEHFMLPSADKLYGDTDFVFQQDLAPAHTAKGTKSWFNDHGVTVLDWPANSPDLNPRENLWGIVKRKMRDTRPNNADELKATVKETWASIPPQQCHKLITSMPRRIEAVIKAKGAPTKYWVHIQ